MLHTLNSQPVLIFKVVARRFYDKIKIEINVRLMNGEILLD